VTSVRTRPSETERCRIERFIFTRYRKSYCIDTPQKDLYETEILCETFELEKQRTGLRDRKKIIRFWKGQEYRLYISLSVYLFPRCQSSTGVGTCDEVQIRCWLFEFQPLKIGWGQWYNNNNNNNNNTGEFLFSYLFKAYNPDNKDIWLFCCILSSCNTLHPRVLRQFCTMSLQIPRPWKFSCLKCLYSSNIFGKYRLQISVLLSMNMWNRVSLYNNWRKI
jgi:hypothetical protein